MGDASYKVTSGNGIRWNSKGVPLTSRKSKSIPEVGEPHVKVDKGSRCIYNIYVSSRIFLRTVSF